MDDIKRATLTTADGNTLDLFYNNSTGLIVLDLNHQSGNGGNELFRRYVSETAALSHVSAEDSDDE